MSAPAGDWTALADTVRERRRQLGIPTQDEAAAQAGVSRTSWQRLETGIPVSARTLRTVARFLGWEARALVAVLDGKPAPAPAGVAPPAPIVPAPELVLPVDRPALVYLATDGRVVQLDRDDLTTMTPRERALCVALLDHARHQLDQATTPPAPAAVTDREEDPNA